MNKIKTIFLLIVAFYTVTAILLLTAQVNYTNAARAAYNTDRTDESIERAMYRHGFIIDAYDTNEPTTVQKVKALFNQPNI